MWARFERKNPQNPYYQVFADFISGDNRIRTDDLPEIHRDHASVPMYIGTGWLYHAHSFNQPIDVTPALLGLNGSLTF
jgi:hypothetical protein